MKQGRGAIIGAVGAPSGEAETQGADRQLGLIAALGAYLIWGVLPAFLKLVETASPYEVLIHRILWSLPFCVTVLSLRRQWSETRAAFGDWRIIRSLTISALIIGGNWLLFILAVNEDRLLEASLGYYINPLIFIAVGVVFLGENLTRLKAVAIALAAAGVIVLIVDTGVMPWTAFTLAISFTVYGLIRKRTPIGAVPGLFIETIVLTLPASAGLFFLIHEDVLRFGGADPAFSALLALSGPFTVIPLTLFAIAARSISLTTIGFLQYIAPTMSMVIALLYGEKFTLAHGICFGLIWTALALISAEAVRNSRQGRQTP